MSESIYMCSKKSFVSLMHNNAFMQLENKGDPYSLPQNCAHFSQIHDDYMFHITLFTVSFLSVCMCMCVWVYVCVWCAYVMYCA